MKIKITADSTCDLSPALNERFDVAIFPLTVTMGDFSGRDGIECTPDMIYDFVSKTNTLPKSSAGSVGEYLAFFQEWVDQGYQVIHFNLSSDFSSTHANARIAAEEIGEDKVFVVDSRNLSTGQGLVVLAAAQWKEDGLSPEEIVQKATDLTGRVEASFVIDQLDYLHKGGRCSSVAKLGANFLKLKPCIEVKEGKMGVGKQYRGAYPAVMLQYISDRLSNRDDIDFSRIFLTHTKCDPALISDLEKKIKEICPQFEEVIETTAGSTITTHCGPNTIGILFIRNK